MFAPCGDILLRMYVVQWSVHLGFTMGLNYKTWSDKTSLIGSTVHKFA